jgi:Flp pilus assembly protein TadG
MSRTLGREPKGQVLVLFALFLVVLIGATAITVDFGSWLKVRRDYQNVADAAALAGTGFLSRPLSTTKQEQARQAAWESLKTQLGLSAAIDPTVLKLNNTTAGGFKTDSGYSMWVSTPPSVAIPAYTGAFTSATSRTLFVQVSKDNPSYFSQIFGQGPRKVTTYATAGQFASRYAVVTLRQPNQQPVSVNEDIKLAGTNTILEVIDGDVGGNWNMKLNGSSQLWLHGVGNNDSDVYLTANVPCGPSCWNLAQINSGPNGTPPYEVKAAQPLPGFVEDPNYILNASISSVPSSASGTAAVPKAEGTDARGDLRVRNGTISGVGCDANSPRIGPGSYHDLRIDECTVLDPTHTYTDPDNADPALRGKADLLQARQPGIFYITGSLDIQANALLVGDGVTLVLRPPNAELLASGGGVVDLNTGASDMIAGGAPNQPRGAFLTDGSSTYLWNPGVDRWTYDPAVNSITDRVGTAVYVVKPAQYGDLGAESSTSVIKVNAGAGMSWAGVTYAPRDNVAIAGQPTHDGIGQVVAWTVTFDGGTIIKQRFDGPDASLPRLLEPTLGQP